MPTVDVTLNDVLKLLAEPVRLRVLALLERAELSVGELAQALGMAQSRVSNHLRLLRDADLLLERHVGASTFLRVSDAREIDTSSHHRIWSALKSELVQSPEHTADLARLERVLAARRTKDGDFFDRVATEWDKIAGDFATGEARQRLLTHLLPREFVVADLGCGTGYIADALLGQCSKLICVDRSEAMLEQASKRLTRAGHTTLEMRRGELDALPLVDGEVDGVLCGMVLHHLANPDAAVREMHRILKPGGSAAVLELAPHKEGWMREALGDRHLGLEAKDVLTAFTRAGFVDVALDPLSDQYCPRTPDGDECSLALYIVRGRKKSP